jgi:hypothetical protein
MAKVNPPSARVKLSFDLNRFAGTYKVEGESGNYFLNPQSDLLVKLCERKEFTALRPQSYLMHRTGEQFKYLTSLYPHAGTDQVFTAEILRTYFTVVFSDDRTTLTVTRNG